MKESEEYNVMVSEYPCRRTSGVFFFQAEDGIRDLTVTGVQTCALPIWGDSYQSVYAQLVSPDKFQEFKDALTSNPQIKVKVVRQAEFYADQSTMTTNFITGIGTVIALMMALGALLGALNTMYNAVASRGREIATLRALGFGRSEERRVGKECRS